MPEVSMYNVNGNLLGKLNLSNQVFGAPVNSTAVYDAVIKYLAGGRSGTSDTKTRGEVNGGGRKPWRQKGTGRARHGSIRSPIWRGGGIVFGPHPRDYSYTLPRKVRRLALKSVLSSKVMEDKMIVIEELKLEKPRTKDIINILDNLKISGGVLLVTVSKDENVYKSARNISDIKTVTIEGLNIYDLLVYETLVVTKDALAGIEEALLNEERA
ncbi:MAG TPA: 50S ribosomal protein L4 [Desulfotomaculum sp.]|nr:MAG: 50S ribosomal protein L4 [Desulfotomaculum sp. 46_80]KUK85350.1 MAG: 50S ribosomal protein L4 [Desulfofundulus kuznetsovii]HAG10607.1 50S ribosomal protein L4 [Desulfotomaculum sp.]HBY03498.1 50S ribosomal protein L4 [Desulfotomaculum sp.]